MKVMRMLIGAMLIIGLGLAAVGCSEKIGQPYTDRSWQKPPPGTGGGR